MEYPSRDTNYLVSEVLRAVSDTRKNKNEALRTVSDARKNRSPLERQILLLLAPHAALASLIRCTVAGSTPNFAAVLR